MINKKLISNAKKIDIFLRKYLSKEKKTFLIAPMKYGVLSGGKKIRSSIILGTGNLFNLNINKLINICAAVECIHSYSLIHDDLPCMDDDKIRRGKPSTHIKFGESTAILAGNSLLTLAFEMIVDKNYLISSNSKLELIKELASCSGHSGVAGGQELDLSFENKKKNFKQIIDMQKKKTGKLFNFCCFAAGAVANKDKIEKKRLQLLGEDIGLLFQLADDFLDIKGKIKIVGKSIKKDKKKGKSTLINLIGYQKAYMYAYNLKTKILRNLKKHGKKAKDLTETIEFILGRNF
jgi:farnesyl diphosphate synthase